MEVAELAAQFTSFKTEMTAALAAKDEEIKKLKTHAGKVLGEKKSLAAKLKERIAAIENGEEDPGEGDEPPARAKKPNGGETESEAIARIQAENAAELAKLKKELDDERAARNKAAIDAELSKALDTAKIKPEYRDAAHAMLMAKRKVEVVNGEVRVDGKKASDSVTEWANSTEGRAFVAAPVNGGSATPPSAPSGGAVKPKSQMTRGERGDYIKEHGASAYYALPA
jgi:hypothetical protein